MNIVVCVGSSCHLKGSYDIIKGFQKLITSNNLEDVVTLSAAFCMGHCTQGVAVKIDENFAEGVSVDNLDDVFEKYVLKQLSQP